MNKSESQKLIADLFARIGRLLSNGVPLIGSLEVTATELSESPELKKILERTCRQLEIGKALADCFKEYPVFSELIIAAISFGEQQGTLDTQLLRISDSILQGDFPTGDFPSIDALDEISGEADLRESIPNIVENLFEKAFRAKASDIHIDPDKEGSRIRFRIDGVLHTQHERLDKAQHNAVVSVIKIFAGLDSAEHKLPQDGRILRSYQQDAGAADVDLRIAVGPFYEGEKVVIRLLYKSGFPDSLEQVMSEKNATIIRNWLNKPNGLILATGPTGSGKTTTLYLMAQELAARETLNVLSIEDPVELILQGIHQMQINPAYGLTMTRAMRAILRMDPDVVLVSEIRDPETAIQLSKIALTGHLTLSQLHTSDFNASLALLNELGISTLVLKQILVGIVSQRLVRKLCPACKQRIPDEEKQRLPEPYKSMDMAFYKPVGCDKCNKIGYRGRLAIYEIFEPAHNFWKTYAEGASLEKLLTTLPENYRSLYDEGIDLISQGLTTWSELDRVISL